MYRFLIMKNMRNVSVRSSVISSELRRSCPLCNNHLIKNNSGKAGISVYDRRKVEKRFNSQDISLMAGLDLSAESVLQNEEVVELLEELENREEPELIDSLGSDVLSIPDSEQAVVKSRKKKFTTKVNRELMAKIKTDELDSACRERNLNLNLASYLELCVDCGLLNRGLSALVYYLNKDDGVKVSNVEVFNKLLEGYARIGNIDKMMEVWTLQDQEKVLPNASSFACRLEAIARSTRVDKAKLIKSTLFLMDKQGVQLNSLFNGFEWRNDSREIVLKGIRAVLPRFMPTVLEPDLSYSSRLLQHLNENEERKLKSPAEGLFDNVDPMSLYEEQVETESKYYLKIKSIEKPVEPTEAILKYRCKLEELDRLWSKSILDALDRELSALAAMHKSNPFSMKRINVYPYLVVLDKNDYKEILIHEIHKLAVGSETFSPTINMLYKNIGSQVKLRYDRKMCFDKGVVDKMNSIYKDYFNWYLDPNGSIGKNGRQQWQLLVYKNQQGPTVGGETNLWSFPILHAIGKFLFKIIMRDIKIDFNVFRQNQPPQMVPGFYPVYRRQGYVSKEEVKPHPVLSRLFKEAHLPDLIFSVSGLPMVAPPIPWVSLTSGGYIISKTNIIRLPHQAIQQWERLKEANICQLYPTFDALNQLASIPWRVNKPVLDVVVEMFNSGGNAKLDVPEPPSSCVLSDALPASLQGKDEKYLAYKQRTLFRRRKAEMYSLWCDALYRLSLANHFRDKIFWLPHNMDFRGRVYPCPPHLNHLGSDLARSLLMFALGKPLGPHGFDWLKLHLVNLTGLKKRDSVEDRLKFADEMMPDILDSAADPLGGRKWWAESEEPWQTLACCIEIKNAMDCSEGVENYVCHFPVHQDGSCNGLQHYAALGRDSTGAISVNLAPSDIPQDVYTCVCNIVERERIKDAAEGMKIAKILEGFVKRKVVKQTIMTTVYGVTRFGARLQIAKQLRDIEDFPKEFVWQGSNYLVAKTFASLREMFTSTREIQDWFTESARMISMICGQNVEYVTPLGLPVVQPYYRFKPSDLKKSSMGQIVENLQLDMFERPNVMKQKNAFPPNFIHSLDSTHMMLTSLHCEQEAITFVSVHDCYWTHPCTVSLMNKICREQFVALHSEPILEDLSKFLVKKYGYLERDLAGDIDAVVTTKRRLNAFLSKVPPTGDFDLSNVLKSVYFFS